MKVLLQRRKYTVGLFFLVALTLMVWANANILVRAEPPEDPCQWISVGQYCDDIHHTCEEDGGVCLKWKYGNACYCIDVPDK